MWRLFALLVACNSARAITGDAPLSDAYRPLDATLAIDGLAVAPSSAAMKWPDSAPLQVLAHFTDDAVLDVTPYATYTTDAPTVAIASGGIVEPIGPGSATLTATYLGVSATSSITVSVPTLVVATSDGVDFLNASASGSAMPFRSIRGPATTLQAADGVAVLGQELFVTDRAADAIDVWPLTGSGNLAPSRRITTSFTPLSIAASGSEIFVGAADGVRVFDATDSGPATPIQTITGSNTGIAQGAGIAVAAGELYVVDQGGSVSVFAQTANGNVAPKRVLTGAATGLVDPVGISVAFQVELVTTVGNNSALEFFSSQNGNVVAGGVSFEGGQSMLQAPTCATQADTRIFVGSPSSSTIDQFVTNAPEGDLPPQATITGEPVQAMTLF